MDSPRLAPTSEFDCLSGALKEQLLPYVAEWDADSLVVGNSAKNLFLRPVFGETELHIITPRGPAVVPVAVIGSLPCQSKP